MTWAQLGIHAKPIGLLDVDDYYEHLLAFFDRAVADQLLTRRQPPAAAPRRRPVRLIDRLAAAAATLAVTSP